MRTLHLRRSRWTAGLLALLALGLLPELVSAQANALFPNIYIKRKRPCTDLESPQYRMMREQYYGYYPTCWRRFPEGWGCVSADAPDWAAAKKKQPLEYPEGVNPPEEATAPTSIENTPFVKPNRPATEGNKPDLELPEDRSLLPGERPPTTPPNGDGAAPANPAAPGAIQPAPLNRADDPFLRNRPQASAGRGSDGGLAPELMLEGAYDPPSLTAPSSSLPTALPAALPAGDSSTALPSENGTGAGTTNNRRGPLANLFGRFRRQ